MRRIKMRKVDLSKVQADLSGYLRLAEKEHLVIIRRGKPVGVLIGFADEEAWFEYCLEIDPRFLQRVATARQSLRRSRCAAGGHHLKSLGGGRSSGCPPTELTTANREAKVTWPSPSCCRA